MNKNELIHSIKNINIRSSEIQDTQVVPTDIMCDLLEQLDEPIISDVHVILGRLRQLAIRDRETWLRIIMKEFGECISDSEYNRGYTNGQLDYIFKDSKQTIPDFIANWIIRSRDIYSLTQAMTCGSIEVSDWLSNEDNQRKFAMAWFYGYAREDKEQKYLVQIKNTLTDYSFLNYRRSSGKCFFKNKYETENIRTHHTIKELEEMGFGEVFNNPLFEVTDVE